MKINIRYTTKNRFFNNLSLLCVLFGLMQYLYATNSATNSIAISPEDSAKIQILDKFINENDWLLKYKNYHEYNIAHNEMIAIELQINDLKNMEHKGKEEYNKIGNLEKRLNILKRQEELLQNFKSEPYKELITPQNIGEIPNITNPFLIPNGISYIKNLKAQLKNIDKNLASLQLLLEKLSTKEQILAKYSKQYHNDETYTQELENVRDTLSELTSTNKVLAVYIDILKNNSANDIQKVSKDVKDESVKLLYIIIAIIFVSGISFLIKFLLKTYAQESDTSRGYTINKFINILNVSLIIFILLFSYIENVAYILAIIGFVSAGLAIAMKDWFMSFFGYMVIVGGGTIKSGDRIRVVKDNTIYVGDVIDISMLRITLYEDVTYTTYAENRRAGRIIFIPNNLIFTTMIANYSHANLRTVWDGVDVIITFKSNYKKAMKIASEIAKKYSNGYSESTRRQLNKLKVSYSLRDMNVEPRVFSFIVPNGVKISVWFQTNSYATLMLNSIISGAIIEAFLIEDDIEISYPTTTVIAKDKNLGDGSYESVL